MAVKLILVAVLARVADLADAVGDWANRWEAQLSPPPPELPRVPLGAVRVAPPPSAVRQPSATARPDAVPLAAWLQGRAARLDERQR